MEQLLPVVGAGTAIAVLALLALVELLRVSGRADHRAARTARLALLPLLIVFGVTATLGLRGLLAGDDPGRTANAPAVTNASPPPETGASGSVSGTAPPATHPGVGASPTEERVPPAPSATPRFTESVTTGPAASATTVAAGRTCADEDAKWRSLPVPGDASDGVFTDLMQTVTLSGTAEGSVSFVANLPVRAVIVSQTGGSLLYRFRPPVTEGQEISTTDVQAAPGAILFCYQPPG